MDADIMKCCRCKKVNKFSDLAEKQNGYGNTKICPSCRSETFYDITPCIAYLDENARIVIEKDSPEKYINLIMSGEFCTIQQFTKIIENSDNPKHKFENHMIWEVDIFTQVFSDWKEVQKNRFRRFKGFKDVVWHGV